VEAPKVEEPTNVAKVDVVAEHVESKVEENGEKVVKGEPAAAAAATASEALVSPVAAATKEVADAAAEHAKPIVKAEAELPPEKVEVPVPTSNSTAEVETKKMVKEAVKEAVSEAVTKAVEEAVKGKVEKVTEKMERAVETAKVDQKVEQVLKAKAEEKNVELHLTKAVEVAVKGKPKAQKKPVLSNKISVSKDDKVALDLASTNKWGQAGNLHPHPAVANSTTVLVAKKVNSTKGGIVQMPLWVNSTNATKADKKPVYHGFLATFINS